MAQYSNNWDASGTGAGIPTGTTGGWNYANGEWSRVDAGSGDIAVQCAAGFNARQIVTLDAVDSDANRANCQVLGIVRTSSVTASLTHGGVVGRASGSAGSETGYVATIFGSELRLAKYTSGTSAELVTTTGAGLAINTDYRILLECTGTTIRAKWWLDGSGEPGSWAVTATDSSISGAGRCGMFAFSGGVTRSWKALAVGTNGDPASLGGTTSVTSDLAGSFALRAALQADLAGSFSLRSAVAADLAGSLQLRSAVQQDLGGSLVVRAAISRDLAGSFDIAGAGGTTSVTSDLGGSFALRGQVLANLAGSMVVRGSVYRDLVGSFDVAGPAGVTSVVSDLPGAFVVRASLVASLPGSFQILGDAPVLVTPSGRIWLIQADDRVTPIYQDDRVTLVYAD